jgi:N-acetylneuraminate synthase
VLEVERELHEKARRAIHAVEDIEAGEELTEENIDVLRPGDQDTGLPPKFYTEVLGRKAEQLISIGDGIHWSDITD